MCTHLYTHELEVVLGCLSTRLHMRNNESSFSLLKSESRGEGGKQGGNTDGDVVAEAGVGKIKGDDKGKEGWKRKAYGEGRENER